MSKSNSMHCEGYRRRGGAFSLGPMTWEQCPNNAVVILTLKQKGEPKGEMPACAKCWEEARDPRWGIKIISAKPILEAKP